jgi:hypothetical protein
MYSSDVSLFSANQQVRLDQKIGIRPFLGPSPHHSDPDRGFEGRTLGMLSAFLCPLGILTGALALVVPTAAQSQIYFEEVTDAAGVGQVSQTYGLAWGDYDGDGWPDLRVGHHGEATVLYRNRRDGTFDNTSHLLQPTGAAADWHTSAWGDFDNDGDQDLAVIAGAAGDLNPFPNRLFVNVNGSFSEQGLALGIDYPAARGRQPVWWDWNGDGFLDLVVTNLTAGSGGATPSTIFEQTADGFIPTTVLPASELIRVTEFSQLGDLTGDGVLELLTGGGHPVSYRILDSSTVPFTDLTDSLGLGTVSLTYDAVVADLTGDLLPDLFLSRHTSARSDVYQSTPTNVGTFFTSLNKELGANLVTSSPVTIAVSPWSTILEDVFIGSLGANPPSNNFTLSPLDANVQGIAPHDAGVTKGVYIGYDVASGRWMIRSSNTIRFEASFEAVIPYSSVELVGFSLDSGEMENHLYTQSPTGLTNATAGSGLEVPDDCDSVVAGDFDNDMDLDLYLVCARSAGNRPNLLYENQGFGTFVAVPAAGGAAGSDLGIGDSVAIADYDQDGFLDLFVTNGWGAPPLGLGPHQLFHNLGNSNHWIEIDLVGTVSNSDGIGASVYVTTGAVTQYRASDGGMHARVQNHKRLHFGLGTNTMIDQLVVEWPSGIVQELELIASDEILTIREPEPSVPGVGFEGALLLIGAMLGIGRAALRSNG